MVKETQKRREGRKQRVSGGGEGRNIWQQLW